MKERSVMTCGARSVGAELFLKRPEIAPSISGALADDRQA